VQPPRHPVDRPVFPPLMLLSLVLWVVAAFVFPPAVPLFLACLVVFIGLYGLGWMLREHELWREGRHQHRR